ncbi:hypothetical protein JW859_14615 [bacterium]|nr:hypothetical protein [bacterium]
MSITINTCIFNMWEAIVFKRSIFLLLTIAACLFLLACGGRNPDIVVPSHESSLYEGLFQLEQQSSVYFSDLTHPLDTHISETCKKVTVTIKSTQDTSLAELLYTLHYDESQFMPSDVQMGMCLGNEEQAIHASFTHVPCEVILAEVMIGLQLATIHKGDTYAIVEFLHEPFSSRSAKIVSDGGIENPRELCWRLRRSAEFTNYDIPFTVDQQGSLVVITWEEALNNDVDNNGIVNSSDITPMGRFFNDELAVNNDYSSNGSGAWALQSPNTTRRNEIHNIGRAGRSPELPQDHPYEPVERNDKDSNEGAGFKYPVTVGDITSLGLYYDFSIDGYIIEFWDGEATPGSKVTSLGLLDDPILRLDRPTRETEDGKQTTRSEALANLGLFSVYDNFELPSKSYFAFYDDLCSIDKQREFDPMSTSDSDKYIYKTVLDLRDYPALQTVQDLHVSVKAIPKDNSYRANWEQAPPEEELTLTWHPTHLYPSPTEMVEPDVEWLSDEGITSIEQGGPDNSNWPVSSELQFRITWGEAQLDPLFYNSLQEWEVKYAIYISSDQSTLWDTVDQSTYVPERRYYPGNEDKIVDDPKDPNPDIVKLFDLDFSSGYFELPIIPSSGSFNPGTVYVGVKAYAVKRFFDDHYIYRTDFIGNANDYLDITFDYATTAEDTYPPSFSGVKYHWKHGGFSTAWRLLNVQGEDKVDTNGVSYINYKARPQFVPHQLSSSGNDLGAAANLHLITRLNDMYDVGPDQVKEKYPFSDLEMRFEIYRTHMMFDSFERILKEEPGGALYMLDQGMLTPYGISLSFPVTSSILEKPYVSSMFSTPYNYTRYSSSFTCPICSPYNLTYNSVLVPFGLTYMSVNQDLEFYTHSYVPVESEEIGYFPYCDFERSTPQNGLLSFVWNEALESGWKYIVFAAVNDENNLCTYDNVIDSDQDEDLSYIAYYAGAIPKFTIGDKRDFAYYPDSGFDEYACHLQYAGTGTIDLSERKTPSGSLPSEMLMYTDSALSPNGNYYGTTYYSDASKKVFFEEYDASSSSWSMTEVDFASEGDTSINYDSSNQPHIAYYRDPSVPDESYPIGTPAVAPGHSTSQRRTSSTVQSGIYYRYRSGSDWVPRELVYGSVYVGPNEHNLHCYSSSPGVDNLYAVIPMMGSSGQQALGIPGMAHRIGTDDWQITELTTTNGVTNMYLDSVQVRQDSDETYVAIYSPFDDTLPDSPGALLLGHWVNSAWTVEPVVTSNVGGYQSIEMLDNGNICMAYMQASDNRLAYVMQSGSSVVDSFVSEFPNTGFNTIIRQTSSGNPVVYSIHADLGMLWRAIDYGNGWEEQSLVESYVDDDDMRPCAFSVLPAANEHSIAWIQPNRSVSNLTLAY